MAVFEVTAPIPRGAIAFLRAVQQSPSTEVYAAPRTKDWTRRHGFARSIKPNSRIWRITDEGRRFLAMQNALLAQEHTP